MCPAFDEAAAALEAMIGLHHAITGVMYTDPARARSLADQIWSIARRFPDDALIQAQAHWSQGSALLPVPDYARALEHYDQALAYYEQACRALAPAEPTRDVRVVQVVRVFCLSELGRYSEAEQATAVAERWLAEHPSDSIRLILLINRSQLAGTMGRYDEMITLADAIITLAATLDSPAEAAMAWVNYGHASIHLGRFAEARDALDKGIAAADQAREPLTAARALWNRARLLRCQGHLFDALRTLREAQRGLAQAENERPALAMEEAAIAAQLHQLGPAYNAALQAALAFAEQQMPVYSVNAALLAARLAIQQKKPLQARQALEQARKQANSGIPPKVQAEIAVVEAQLIHLRAQDDANSAPTTLPGIYQRTVEATQTLTQHGLVQEAALGTLAIAALDTLLGDHAAAIAGYRQLLYLPYPHLQIAANAQLGDLLPPTEALPYLQRAADLAVVQRRLLPVEELQARYSSETSVYHLRLAMCHLAMGQIEASFTSICSAKAGPLLDLRAATTDLDQATRGELERDKAEVARWRERRLHHERQHWRAIQRGQHKSAAYHEQQRHEAGVQIQHHEAMLTRKMNTIGGRAGVAPLPTPDDVRQALQHGQMLLEFSCHADEIVCFIVRNDQPIKVRHLGRLAAIAQSFRRWELVRHGLMAGTITAGIEQQIETGIALLREALYEPLENELHGITDLLIAPIDILHDFPWSLLFSPADCTLTLTPCGAMWAAPLTWNDAPTGPPRIIGYAGRGHRLLPNVALELAAIHDRLPTAQVVPNATTTDLQTPLPPRLLHIAAHCTTSPAAPLASSIELADGVMTLLEAHRLRLHGTQFVALSACATAERPHHGDMALALAGAFLCAGVRAVLASLWPVDDTATRLLMEHFYTALSAGATPATALHNAQHQVRDAYPFDWAAFQIWAGAAM